MIREGWGVVYVKTGAEYGDWDLETYLAAQAEATVCFFFFPFLELFSGSTYCARVRAARRGIWHGGTDIETPASIRSEFAWESEGYGSVDDLEPEVEKVSFWSRIFGRMKRDGKTSL